MGANAQTAVPVFTANQILTAAQVTQINTGIPVFATETTRNAAFSGSGEKVLAQGQYAYIEATSTLQVYTGSAWVTATSGLVYITSGTVTLGSALSFDNCFSATYTNYKIVFNSLVSGTNVQVRMRMRAGGSDDSNSLYSFSNLQQNTSTGGTASGGVGRDTTQFGLGSFNNYANGQSLSFDIFNPFAAKNTNYGPGCWFDDEIVLLGFISGVHKSTTSFDGFTIFPASSTLAGTFKVYGYANS